MSNNKLKDSMLALTRPSPIIKFSIILTVVFLSQIPGCAIVIADDAGQINYFKYETLIEISKATFAFPLKLVFNSINSYVQLLVMYVGNLIVLSWLIFLLLIGYK